MSAPSDGGLGLQGVDYVVGIVSGGISLIAGALGMAKLQGARDERYAAEVKAIKEAHAAIAAQVAALIVEKQRLADSISDLRAEVATRNDFANLSNQFSAGFVAVAQRIDGLMRQR